MGSCKVTGTTPPAEIACAEASLRPGLLKWGRLLLLMLLLTVVGALIAVNGRATGWVIVAVTIPLALLFLWCLVSKRMHLQLAQRGFSFGTLRKQYSYSWSDIAYFGVVEFGRERWVCFVLSPHYVGEEHVQATNQAFGGFDRFLPDTYGMRAEELAALLEAWRARAGREVAQGRTG